MLDQAEKAQWKNVWNCIEWYLPDVKARSKTEEKVYFLDARKQDRNAGTQKYWHYRNVSLSFHTTGACKTLLLIAAAQNDKNAVQRLLKHQADTNVWDASGATPLYIAAGNGNAELVELLLKNHANVSKKADVGYTALLCAVHYAGTLATQARRNEIAKRAALDVWTEKGSFQYEEVVKKLLQAKANVHDRDSGERTALHIAVTNAQVSVVQLFVLRVLMTRRLF